MFSTDDGQIILLCKHERTKDTNINSIVSALDCTVIVYAQRINDKLCIYDIFNICSIAHDVETFGNKNILKYDKVQNWLEIDIQHSLMLHAKYSFNKKLIEKLTF